MTEPLLLTGPHTPDRHVMQTEAEARGQGEAKA